MHFEQQILLDLARCCDEHVSMMEHPQLAVGCHRDSNANISAAEYMNIHTEHRDRL